jgi:hypothetical protein
LLKLDKPAEAAATAEQGLRLFDNSYIRALAYCNLRLGMARLMSGEVEEAARVVGDAAVLATKNRSARLTGEVTSARGHMQPWQHTAAVKELDERLTAYGLA